MHVTKFWENPRNYTWELRKIYSVWDITENFIEHSLRPIQGISVQGKLENNSIKKNRRETTETCRTNLEEILQNTTLKMPEEILQRHIQEYLGEGLLRRSRKNSRKIFLQRRTRENYTKFRRDEWKNVSSNLKQFRVTPKEMYFSKFGTE